MKRLDVLLVVVLVEALHFSGVTLLDPPLERGIVLPLEPLKERGFELADATAAGGGVEAMSLLEGVEAAWKSIGCKGKEQRNTHYLLFPEARRDSDYSLNSYSQR